MAKCLECNKELNSSTEIIFHECPKVMPENITAMRAITYDTKQIVSDLAEAHEKPENEVTLAEVMEWITENAEEDLTCWRGAIFKDENGKEIDA